MLAERPRDCDSSGYQDWVGRVTEHSRQRELLVRQGYNFFFRTIPESCGSIEIPQDLENLSTIGIQALEQTQTSCGYHDCDKSATSC